MKRRTGAFVGVLGLSLVLSCVLGEAVVRYRERNRSTVPGIMPTLYYRHARLGHALVRDFSYFGWFRTDTAGFRWTDDGQRRAGGRPIILVLGGSTTFDTAVSPDLETWPARLEAWLRKEEAGFSGSVLNAGVSGYDVVDNLIRLETDLADFQPDAILLYQAHNDLFSAFARSSADVSRDRHRPDQWGTVTPWRAWLEEHSLLYAKVAGRIKALRFRGRREREASGPAPDWDDVLNKGGARFERDLESFVAVARARGILVVLMTVTHVSSGDSVPRSELATRSWANTMPGVPPSVALEGYRRFNARIRAVAQRHAIPLIDGAASSIVGPELYAEGDAVHFNAAGADRFARFVAGQFVRLVPDTTHSTVPERAEP
jgi:lysophospholipase L1-like esterase